MIRGRRDGLGTVIGLATFLGGIALLLLTFKLAFEMFSVPPQDTLNLKPGQTLEVATVGSTITGLVVRILLLIVMALVSSFIANRGIHLFAESRGLEAKSRTVKTEQE